MNFSNRKGLVVTLLIAGGTLLSCIGYRGHGTAFAQSGNSQAPAAQAQQATPPVDQYDRIAQLWYYQRMAKGGWERGQEIYKMKCWICHNDYTVKAQPGAAPTLRGLYKRSALWSGQPVNDQTVTTQIRNGSPRMAAYRYVLSDKDISDLVTYLREKCCWDEMNPPPNPRYHP
jgi:mono/diheme cytochrome c family protein